MEVVGADHRDLGIILPGRAESDRKAGLQGDTDLDEHNESVQTIEGRVCCFSHGIGRGRQGFLTSWGGQDWPRRL